MENSYNSFKILMKHLQQTIIALRGVQHCFILCFPNSSEAWQIPEAQATSDDKIVFF